MDALYSWYLKMDAWELYEASLLLVGHRFDFPMRLWRPELGEVYYAAERAIIAGTLPANTRIETYTLGGGEAKNAPVQDVMVKARQWCPNGGETQSILYTGQSTTKDLASYFVRQSDFLTWALSRGYEIPKALRGALRGNESHLPESESAQIQKSEPSPTSLSLREIEAVGKPKKDFFISYNSADRAWAEWIAWTLEEAGYSVIIQAWDFRVGNNFVLEMENAASNTEKTVVVLSDDYLNALYTQPEWAAAFAEDPTGSLRKLITFRVATCEIKGLRQSLIYADLMGLSDKEAQHAILEALKERGKPAVKPVFPGSATRVISHIAITEAPVFPQETEETNDLRSETPRLNSMASWCGTLTNRQSDLVDVSDTSRRSKQFDAIADSLPQSQAAIGGATLAQDVCGCFQVSIAHLPPLPAHFMGRDDELAWLDARWAEATTGVVTLVAFGGVGKSSLVADWVKKLVDDGGRGARKIFGHSFYSQGSREDAGASSDEFMGRALEFFGDPDPLKGSPWDKGERLARLARRERALLVLDGLEPLQQPPTSGDAGRLKDPALQALIRELAASNPGLCVVTTRERVADIPSAPVLNLEQLSDTAGAALLAALGVQGPQSELEAASHDVRGHGLALRLLGTYLVRACGGDVRRRSEVALAEADEVQGGHAFKIMENYVRWFGEGIEVAILRILGLFNRPAEADCVQAVRVAPAIPGLTESFIGIDDKKWRSALSMLAECGLVLMGEHQERSTSLDAHPLVREYFAKHLAVEFRESAKEAHRRIYEHLKVSTPELPDTLVDMIPLYHAVVHGCAAGLHEQVGREVYRDRILRGNEFFSWKKLGAVGADLGVVACFFEHPWDCVSENFSEANKSWVLNSAGFLLRALCRFDEAMEPLSRAVNDAITAESWDSAATYAGNLAELKQSLGQIADAVRVGEEIVELADRGGNVKTSMINRTTLADILHQTGQYLAACAAFRHSEALQGKYQPEIPQLYSMQGLEYCELLLEDGNFLANGAPGSRQQHLHEVPSHVTVRLRAEKIIEFAGSKKWIIDIGLAKVLVARCFIVDAQSCVVASVKDGLIGRAIEILDESVQLINQAGTQQFIPKALLARAMAHRIQGDFAAANKDLAEVESLGERSRMLLFQVDAAVERCRWHLAQDNLAAARESLDLARSLVKKSEKPYVPHIPTWEGWKPLVFEGIRYDNVFKAGDIVGYHRRNPEIEALEGALGEDVQ